MKQIIRVSVAVILLQGVLFGQMAIAGVKTKPSQATADSYTWLVLESQKSLKSLGYYPGPIDGIWGPRTLQGVNTFQVDTGLPVTGQLDTETVQYLNQRTLVLLTQDFRPLHYEHEILGSKLQGPIPDAIRAACKLADLTCILRLHKNWGQAQEEVRRGRVDGLFLIGWNAERAKWLHRSRKIVDAEYGVFVRADNPLEFTDMAQLDGATIGVYGPSNVAKTLHQLQTDLRNHDKDFSIVQMEEDDPLFHELSQPRNPELTSQIDAIYSNNLTGFVIVSGQGLRIRYAGRHKPLQYYVGFSQERVDTEVVKRFNSGFTQLEEDGYLQQIYAAAGLGGLIQKPVIARAAAPVEQSVPRPDRYRVDQVQTASLVQDGETCLIWQQAGSLRVRTFPQAMDYVHELNQKGYGGYSDWRLPSSQELLTLLQPEIQPDNRLYIHPVFAGTQQAVWSNEGTLDDRVFIDFYDKGTASKSPHDTNYVRAVRGQGCVEVSQSIPGSR